MLEIVPSPGTQDKEWAVIEKKIESVKPFAKTIHIDVVDGKFAPNVTFTDPLPFAKYTKDLIFEAHFMVDEPINYLKPWAAAGFQRFIGHVEKMSDQAEFVAEAELLGDVGLGIDLDTSVEAIKVPWGDLDVVLVMTVKAGFSGQSFQESAMEKVKRIASLTTVPIEIDGGVNDETIKIACVAGARRFVATSFLFGGESSQQQYKFLKESAEIFKDK